MVAITHRFYMVDQDGDQITFPDSVENSESPWIITVEVDSGPGALGDNADNTCEFDADGHCDLPLSLDTAGGPYQLSFTVRVDGTAVSTIDPNPLVMADITVLSRPLSVKVTDQPKVWQDGVSFANSPLIVSIWDDALDAKAAVSLTPSGVTCTLSLKIVAMDGTETDGTIDGTTAVEIDTSSTQSQIAGPRFGITGNFFLQRVTQFSMTFPLLTPTMTTGSAPIASMAIPALTRMLTQCLS